MPYIFVCARDLSMVPGICQKKKKKAATNIGAVVLFGISLNNFDCVMCCTGNLLVT